MNKKFQYIIFLLGALIIGYSLFIYLISPDFTYAAEPSKQDIVSYIIVRILVGIVYTFSILLLIRKKIFSTSIVIFIFVVGLLSRLILLPTEPILEDDFNRYLWDGAVTANGYNPYEYSPKLFLVKDSTNIIDEQKLYDLADSSGEIIEKINHPHIRTIYPPVAQITFAIAYFIKPWSTTVWKGLLLLLDLLVFYLLLKVLKILKYGLSLIAIYWWNPILLHEIFNAAHMDLIMYPLIVGAVLFFLKNKIIASSSLLALAVGAKLWPIVYIPFILKKVVKNRKTLLTCLIISSGIIMFILFPIIVTKLDNSLGFITYSKNWTNNESVFQLINISIKNIINLFGFNYHCSLCVARMVIILFYVGVTLFLLRTKESNNNDTIRKLFLLVAIIFLISPTQFPWYYTWVLPILILNPRLSFVAYTILLPLYQLKYSWPFLVWVEHLPIIILFIIEIINPRIGDYLLVKERT